MCSQASAPQYEYEMSQDLNISASTGDTSRRRVGIYPCPGNKCHSRSQVVSHACDEGYTGALCANCQSEYARSGLKGTCR